MNRPSPATVVFLDLVRFTSLADIHGDVSAADAADTLARTVRGSLSENMWLVKLLGDGALVIAERPADGLRTAVSVVERLHDGSTGLDVRGGIHFGPVVWRHGDVFGTAVNLSARLAALADSGTLVMTRAVAEHGADLGLDATPLGEQISRGLRTPVEVFRSDPCRHDEAWVIDPVCGMRLREVDAISPLGRVGFCSTRCQALFRTKPEHDDGASAET